VFRHLRLEELAAAPPFANYLHTVSTAEALAVTAASNAVNMVPGEAVAGEVRVVGGGPGWACMADGA